MDLKKISGKVTAYIHKYKYVALVLFLGLVLMLIPSNRKQEGNVEPQDLSAQVVPIQQQIEQLLSPVQGAGTVKVLLCEKSGIETVYQTDENMSVSENSTTTKIDTVTINDGQRIQSGLIRQVNPATYSGALILCQGAEDLAVKLAITEAVSKITGLGADKIAVLKMK